MSQEMASMVKEDYVLYAHFRTQASVIVWLDNMNAKSSKLNGEIPCYKPASLMKV